MKNTVNKNEKTATDYEKTTAKHVFDKGRVSKMQILLKLNQQNKQPIKKWAKDLNAHPIKEVKEMENNQMKRFSIEFII